MRLLRKVTALAVAFALTVTAVPLGASAKEEYTDEYGEVHGITDDGLFEYVIWGDGKYASITLLEDKFYIKNDDGTLTTRPSLEFPGEINGLPVMYADVSALDIGGGVWFDGTFYEKEKVKTNLGEVCFNEIHTNEWRGEEFELLNSKEIDDPDRWENSLLKTVFRVYFTDCKMDYVPSYFFEPFTYLSYITIPEGTVKLKEDAFYGRDYLSVITLPDSLIEFEDDSFYNSGNLEKIYTNNEHLIKQNPYICHVEGIDERKRFDGVEFIKRKNIKDATIRIPNSVTVSAYQLLEGVHLSNITIDIDGYDNSYGGISIRYKNNHAYGTATVIFEGSDEYCGTVTRTFKILSNGYEGPTPTPTAKPRKTPVPTPVVTDEGILGDWINEDGSEGFYFDSDGRGVCTQISGKQNMFTYESKEKDKGVITFIVDTRYNPTTYSIDDKGILHIIDVEGNESTYKRGWFGDPTAVPSATPAPTTEVTKAPSATDTPAPDATAVPDVTNAPDTGATSTPSVTQTPAPTGNPNQQGLIYVSQPVPTAIAVYKTPEPKMDFTTATTKPDTTVVTKKVTVNKPDKPSVKVTKKGKKLAVKFTFTANGNAAGCQVMAGFKKSLKGSVKAKGKKTFKVTLKNYSKQKKIYFKARAYANASGVKYSGWTKVYAQKV